MSYSNINSISVVLIPETDASRRFFIKNGYKEDGVYLQKNIEFAWFDGITFFSLIAAMYNRNLILIFLFYLQINIHSYLLIIYFTKINRLFPIFIYK